MRLYGTIFTITFGLVAMAFWHYWGSSLQYDVFASSNGDSALWYSEDFSQEFRIGFTIFVALIAAALPTWLVYAYRHDYHHGTKSNATGNA